MQRRGVRHQGLDASDVVSINRVLELIDLLGVLHMGLEFGPA